MSVLAKNEVVVKDACILFDLIDMGLLAHFYRLELVVITTPQVIAEVIDEVQLAEITVYLENGKLQIDQFGQLETISSILDSNPGLGFTDASVLEVATRRHATILSSDKSLRNESNRRGLTVKGLLWILEMLYEQDILSLEAVLEKLRSYYDINKRAPKNEIDRLIAKLSQPNTT